MNRFAKTTIATISGLAAVCVPLAQANAGDWGGGHRHWGDRQVVVRHHNNNDALVGGLIGLTAGIILMDAMNQPRRAPVYRAPQVYDYPPAPPQPYPRRVVRYDYQGGLEPWSRDWYRYCSNRYQSFNPETGTYRGYDGRDHFCAAN